MAALEQHAEPEFYPWERQPNESARAWMAFQEYRDGGTLRSLRKLSMVNSASQLRKVGKWSSEWGWVTRVQAFDQMMERQRIGARIAAVRDMEDRHAQVAQSALAVLSMPLIALGRQRRVTVGEETLLVDRLLQLEALPTSDRVRLAAHSTRSIGRISTVERMSRAEDEDAIPVATNSSGVEPLPEAERLRAMFEAFAESGLMVSGTFQVGAPEPTIGVDGLPVLEAAPEPEP